VKIFAKTVLEWRQKSFFFFMLLPFWEVSTTPRLRLAELGEGGKEVLSAFLPFCNFDMSALLDFCVAPSRYLNRKWSSVQKICDFEIPFLLLGIQNNSKQRERNF
jgi:hypothetical protein